MIIRQLSRKTERRCASGVKLCRLAGSDDLLRRQQEGEELRRKKKRTHRGRERRPRIIPYSEGKDAKSAGGIQEGERSNIVRSRRRREREDSNWRADCSKISATETGSRGRSTILTRRRNLVYYKT